jgi:hypothetical protein
MFNKPYMVIPNLLLLLLLLYLFITILYLVLFQNETIQMMCY